MPSNQHAAAPTIVCFGEVLWDVFPSKKMPGGAPLNVAYHLTKLGLGCALISRLGADADGELLRKQLADWGLPTQHIGLDATHPTSTVDLRLDEANEASYRIHEGVAWDYIPALPEYEALVAQAGGLVFGTLAMRHEVSYQTLLGLLRVARVKVLDINVRLPHFDMQKVLRVLPQVTILKLNKAELNFIIEALHVDLEADEDVRARYLQAQFGIEEIILTKGSKGATYYGPSFCLHHDTYKIVVNDTVGSGDAFLAGFLSARFQGGNGPVSIIDKATAVGAFNTTQEGACPAYSLADLAAFEAAHRVLAPHVVAG